jgi:hypothetical protein
MMKEAYLLLQNIMMIAVGGSNSQFKSQTARMKINFG